MAAPEEYLQPSVYEGSDEDRRAMMVKEWKSAAIGSSRQKDLIRQRNLIPQLLGWLLDTESDDDFLVEVAVLLGSLAMGPKEAVNSLVDAGVVRVLLKGLSHDHRRYVEACLRCLRSILINADPAPIEDIYNDQDAVSVLMRVANVSTCSQECVAIVLARSCQTSNEQRILLNAGAVETMAPLLFSGSSKVQLCSLDFYSALCYKNYDASFTVANFIHMGRQLTEQFVAQMSRSNTLEMQVAAARCLTNICRSGALEYSHNIITLKVMPTLVRGCRADVDLGSAKLRVDSCDTLTYLIEEDLELQRLTSWNNQCLKILNSCLNGGNNMSPELATSLRSGAMAVIAALASNDEDIRKKVIVEIPNLLDYVVSGLNSSDDSPKLLHASIKCLLALSRSVEQLRTTFLDRQLWRRLLILIQQDDEELTAMASSVLANLVLEFSPNKLPLVDAGCIETFCELARREEPSLRLNGIWGLMNLAFRSDEKVKQSIVSSLSPEQLLRLLTETPPELPIVLRLLGLLRNLLSQKTYIDRLMSNYGASVMQAIIFVLEGDYSAEAKEQALCVLSNIAEGDSSKDFIMSNEDVLRKITNYMVHANTRLQVAATSCICNLVWKESPGFVDRQAKLRELGVHNRLQQLIQQQKNDPLLYDKVKVALQHFG